MRKVTKYEMLSEFEILYKFFHTVALSFLFAHLLQLSFASSVCCVSAW